ncbi:glutathione S-transferase family protein [Defluviimonas sp. WL0002]|uniref:Glutathione S-transferase family protein n=1 Tax=Albidovulum marisflavi TaxID=2984159 RepID=A0ABT2Z9U0_9RHOB|nr:glutathione S-transferase family protein [Defluviimonas sp. WL0002]MCV2867861.1 glutathione S-transferase family protein [Defluviimonas sp. WL0002]
MGLTCHYIDGSPFARMIRVVARELALDMTEVEISEFPPSPAFFGLNPLGQAPVLVRDGTALFPTEIALMALGEAAGPSAPTGLRDVLPGLSERQLLAVVLSLGDQIAALRYRNWAGLAASGPNRLGFDLDERAGARISATLDWLEARIGPNGFRDDGIGFADVALACLLLWTESRGPIPWRGRKGIEIMVERMAARPSFASTAPRDWPN